MQRIKTFFGKHWFSIFLLISMPALVLFLLVKSHDSLVKKIERSHGSLMKEIQWRSVVNDFPYKNNDSISLDSVGVIQFFNNGYSIVLDAVKYTQNGVELAGELGNAYNLSISTLTLNLLATRMRGNPREYFFQEISKGVSPYMAELYLTDTVSKAQVYVGNLAPGGRAKFKITLPNINQENASLLTIKAYFTGESYGHLR